MRNGVQVERFDDLVRAGVVRQIGLISEYQEWDTFQRGLFEQVMEFRLGCRQGHLVCRVDNKAELHEQMDHDILMKPLDLHDRVHVTAVALPHRSKSWLATQIPAASCQQDGTGSDLGYSPLEGYMAFGHPLHVEPHRGNGAVPLVSVSSHLDVG